MKVLVIGSFSGGNLGDMTILVGLEKAFSEMSDDVTLLVPTSRPAAVLKWVPTAQPLSVPGHGVIYTEDMLRAVREADVVITTAGQIVQARHLLSGITVYWPIIRYAAVWGVPVRGVCVGIYPVGPTDLLRDALAAHTTITVRDSASVEAAHAMGIDVLGPYADLAHIVLSAPPPRPARAVGLNLSVHCAPSALWKAEKRAQARAQALGLPLEIIETAAMDSRLARAWAARLHVKHHRLETYGVVKAQKVLAGMAEMITSRLHATIYATSLGIPTTAVGPMVKVKSYMADCAESLGAEDFSIRRAALARAGFHAAMGGKENT